MLVHASIVGFALIAAIARDTSAQATNVDWSTVEQALGRRGAMQPAAVMRFAFPRTDLRVTAAGVEIRPALALGSWAAFMDVGGGHVMVMGDLVLTEDEVDPVIRTLQNGGVKQTALHNHLLNESPRVMYLHIHGHGERTAIATTIREALALTKTPLDTAGAPGTGRSFELDTARIASTLGFRGRVNGGVYQVSVPRAETIREADLDEPSRMRTVPPAMGLATAINFQPTGDGRAAITGDFVMTAREVNPVIRALRENGIAITALHSHLLTEQPRLFFLHFWANDDALKLARGLRAALDQTNSRRTAGP
jgi:5-enolpyruvylshikimate-3-phosphate synthase